MIVLSCYCIQTRADIVMFYIAYRQGLILSCSILHTCRQGLILSYPILHTDRGSCFGASPQDWRYGELHLMARLSQSGLQTMSPQFPRVDRATVHLLQNSHVRNSALYNIVAACSGQEIHGACFFLYDYSYGVKIVSRYRYNYVL